MMKLHKNNIDLSLRAAYRMLLPIVDPLGLVSGVLNYPSYFDDLRKFKAKANKNINWQDLHPILNNKRDKTEVDYHYFYQALWLFEKVFTSKPKVHYDVASDILPLGLMAQFTRIVFVDIRPVPVDIRNFNQLEGDATSLPFKSATIQSLSCCHVIEHIGLGRYGDKIDPDGSIKAAKELKRCLAKGGNLFLTLPIGQSKVKFNAHRIFNPKEVDKMFSGLKCIEFKIVSDSGKVMEGDKIFAAGQNYALGMYHYVKL